MRKIKYKIIACLIILLLAINVFLSHNGRDVALAQEVTDSVMDERDADEQKADEQDENKQDEDEQDKEKPDEEGSDEKAPEITVSTNPEVGGSEGVVPVVTEALLEYIITADEPCDVILHIEKITIVATGGKVTELLEKEEKAFTLAEDSLEYSLTFEEEGEYAIYATAKDAAGNETETEKTCFKIDRTPPVLNISGVENGAYYNEKQTVQFLIRDFTPDLEKTVIAVWKDEERLGLQKLSWVDADGNGYQYKTQLPLEEEGNYKIVLEGTDQAGDKGESVTVSFRISWTAPTIKAECDMDYTIWSNRDITFHTTVSDSKVGIKKITYKANGKTIKKITFDEPVYAYDYELTISENADKVSGYPVIIEATNNCGISSMLRRRVYIDKEAPELELSGVENGVHYNSDQSITVDVGDVSYSGTATIFVVKRTLDGKTHTMYVPAFHSQQYKDTYSQRMTREGNYKIYAIATDSAGNVTKSNTLSFVIDKTAPKLNLSGVDADSVNNAPVTLNISCVEAFYITNSVSIQVERKLDGKTTTKELTGFPRTKKKSTLQHTFTEDGIYRVSVSAKDKAGNISQAQALIFSVDQTKPEIRIRGTGNYEQWGKSVTLQFTVVESFYQDNTVIISGTRRDMYGVATDIELPKLAKTGKTSTLSQTFTEDGIYTFKVSSKDKAGNENSGEIHFTIDQTAPRINGIKKFDGGCYPEFKLADTLDGLFEDLTVISYRILLNGVEYNGTDTITEEGKYNLYVMVEDELGHTSSETIEFMIVHAKQENFFEAKDREDLQEKSTVNRSSDFVYNNEKTDEPKLGVIGLLFVTVCLCFLGQRRKRKGMRENDDKSNRI